MGVSWQTPDQKVFIEKYFPSYVQHSLDGTAKGGFWPGFLDEWFKAWPLPEPSPELVEKEGSVQKAARSERNKKVGQLKRVFKTASEDVAAGGRRKLNLESSLRKRTEVQVYMSLYYDTRIRPTVVKEWGEVNLPNMDFSRPEVPEEQVDPEDSHLFKDTKIPLCFKNNVAQRLYEAEEEAIKAIVRSKRENDLLIKTVYNVSGEEERLELVREYQKNVPSLKKSMTTVLKNVERKCAAKGIFWLACPAPHLGGRPSGYLHCAGETSDNQDFETFIGPEKTKEFKLLFSRWIHTIYPTSDWALFSPNKSAASTTTPAEDEAIANLFGVTSPIPEVSAATLAPTLSTPPSIPEPSTSSIMPDSSATSSMPGTSTPSLALLPPTPHLAAEFSAPSNLPFASWSPNLSFAPELSAPSNESLTSWSLTSTLSLTPDLSPLNEFLTSWSSASTPSLTPDFSPSNESLTSWSSTSTLSLTPELPAPSLTPRPSTPSLAFESSTPPDGSLALWLPAPPLAPDLSPPSNQSHALRSPALSLTPELSTPSLTPKSSTPSLALELSIPLNQSDRTHQPGTMQSAIGTSTPDPMYDESDITPTQPIRTSDRLGAVPGRAGTRDAPHSNVPPGPASQPPIMTTVLVPSEADPGCATAIPNSGHSTDQRRWVAPGRTHLQASARLPGKLANHGTTPGTNPASLADPLVNVTNEPAWMKKKQTLNYFRGAFKLGDLSGVIRHWYELERLLGFQGVTPPGFPITKRPAVVRPFYKNGHSYGRDYNVEVHTLGHQIMEWWAEISPPDGIPSIQFGGPTGIYTLVVLLSWWCRLLKARPDRERIDCLRTLTDVNRVLVAAINGIEDHPATTTSPLLSLTSPPPASQPRKRASSVKMSPRKRTRSARI